MRRMPANRLREIRESVGLSARDLADRLGVHESTISRWETLKVCIPDERKQELAELFGTSVAYLMGWDEPNGDGDNGNGDGERKAA